MKPQILIIQFLLFSICSIAQEKDGILLEPSLQPNKTYRNTITMAENMTIEFVDKALEAVFIKKGAEYPMRSNKSTLIGSILKTGVSNNEKFSLYVLYDKEEKQEKDSFNKSNNASKTANDFKGTEIYGWIENKKTVTIDSIVGLKDAVLKGAIEQGLKSMINKVNYPKVKLFVGDTFTTRTPMKFPSKNGLTMDLMIINTHKLDSISNAIAYFSFVIDMVSNTAMQAEGIAMEGLSKGNGNIVYDSNEKTFLLYKTEMDTNSALELSGIKCTTKGKNISTMKTEILSD
jgi:hypothetical protein